MAKIPDAPENLAREHIIPFVKPEKEPEPNASERVNTFIQQNRRAVLTVAAGLLVILIGFMAGLSIRDALRAKAIQEAEALGLRYEALRNSLGDSGKDGDVQALIQDLSAFASARSGYAGARGYDILGSIYAEKKDWENAEKAWAGAAAAGAGTYLAPVFFFNAAVAAEEQGKVQEAIDLYAKAQSGLFPQASRAQFQIGRLEEGRGSRDAALQAYREVINKWPKDAVWANLAQSRIITLSLKQDDR
ncbi:MAG: tetratricopeptide repeat protein [Spirochaetaceae bacterium]|jgi:tetratricopeptide (TPR) repeat protein|nr:tetratricopeptide repeat protein [Spirochaetaceae bacterium]